MINLSDETLAFIRAHQDDDLERLLLSASRYSSVDVPFAVDQIRARRRIREKLPTWFANERLIFPSRLSVEQCSSERTADYKCRLVAPADVVCDLTGGLGVDSYFLSRQAARVIYIERFEDYCAAAQANFQALRADNIEVRRGDAVRMVDEMEAVDCFYVDPARRGEGDKRLFALADCEPDLPALLPALWRKAPRVIAKLSPMADLKKTLEALPATVAIHILSVRNECKELLFEMEREAQVESPRIECVNFRADGEEERFVYSWMDEAAASVSFAPAVAAYLYEPNASILKAGAFKRLALDWDVRPLHANSHLYTSPAARTDFPGRVFRVVSFMPFNNKLCKTLRRTIPQANITVRNFPLSVKELRAKTRIAEGGDRYLFATTMADGARALILAAKLQAGD